MEYIKYTLDGQTVYLENINGVWQKTLDAPDVPGMYALALEVSNNYATTYIDSSDSRYNLMLNVLGENEGNINLLDYLPEELASIREFEVIMSIESSYFNKLYGDMNKTLDNCFLDTMQIEIVQRLENFLGILGEGSLEQRKSYINSLFKKGTKLNEKSIKSVVSTITGSKAIIKFFTGNEVDAPISGQGTLRIQVLSPDPLVNYKFDDISRVISPLIPAHIKLMLLKYFATWEDVKSAYTSWQDIKLNALSWADVNNYIPPQQGN